MTIALAYICPRALHSECDRASRRGYVQIEDRAYLGVFEFLCQVGQLSLSLAKKWDVCCVIRLVDVACIRVLDPGSSISELEVCYEPSAEPRPKYQ